MKYIRYCTEDSTKKYGFRIYDLNTAIGYGNVYLTSDKENIIEYYNLIKVQYEYAHICNKKEFKCNHMGCNHMYSGEIPLMLIEKHFSKRKLNLILLNEQFVANDDFDILRPKNSLMDLSLVSYNQLSINSLYNSGIILRCLVCQMQFEKVKGKMI